MRNILVVDLGKSYGGAEKYVEQLTEMGKGVFNFFFLVRKNSLLEQKLLKYQVHCKILSINFSKMTFPNDLYNTIKFIKKYHISIMHTNGINSEFFISIIRFLLMDKAIKYITTVHGIAEYDRMQSNELKKLVFAKLQVRLIENFNNIIAVSNSIKEDLIKKGIERKKIVIIYHGIKPRYTLPQYRIHNPFRICSIGRLEKVKNISLLVWALNEIRLDKNIDYCCDIYGSGNEYETLKALIEELGLDDKIKLKGYAQNVEDVYSKHDLLVQPSIYESFGFTILEAMNAGVPVLCSNVGGMAEIVKDEVNGLLFDINSVHELANKISECIQNKYDLITIRKRAFQTLCQNYTLEITRNKTYEIYDRQWS